MKWPAATPVRRTWSASAQAAIVAIHGRIRLRALRRFNTERHLAKLFSIADMTAEDGHHIMATRFAAECDRLATAAL